MMTTNLVVLGSGRTRCNIPHSPGPANACLCYYFQVRGHHIAKLDPLGISCVNFDGAPVTVSSNVGENASVNANFNVILLFFTPSLFFFSCPLVCDPSLAGPLVDTRAPCSAAGPPGNFGCRPGLLRAR